ncbi:MAG: Hsp20/alpha crystallin family protein, partial [bacterium]|nr:Hsp20/alpha crystallin family protein [bacterium]
GVQNEDEQTPKEKPAPAVSSREKEKTPAKKVLKPKSSVRPEKKSSFVKTEEIEKEPEPKKQKSRIRVQDIPEDETPEPEKKPEAETKDINYIKEEIRIESNPQPEDEGQLAIDVYQTDDNIVVQSAVGGIKPANLEVTIENGIVQIKGSREKAETVKKDDYIISECYWGSFSRQFVLPAEVDASRAEALLKDGIITIKVPKINKEKVMKLEIR